MICKDIWGHLRYILTVCCNQPTIEERPSQRKPNKLRVFVGCGLKQTGKGTHFKISSLFLELRGVSQTITIIISHQQVQVSLPTVYANIISMLPLTPRKRAIEIKYLKKLYNVLHAFMTMKQ